MTASPFTNKLYAHLDRLIEWKKTGDCVPVTWEIDLTNRCQHNCIRCVAGAWDSRKNELTGEQALNTIDQIADLGGRGLIFTGGGEPTLHRSLDDCILRAVQRGLDVGLITNGGVARDWTVAAKHSTWIRFSLDAHDARSFSVSHGVPARAWHKVLDQIKACVRVPGRAATVGLGYLVDRERCAGMVQATRLAHKLGVDYLQFRPYLPSRPGQKIDYDPKQFGKQLKRCQKLENRSFHVFCSSAKFQAIKHGELDREYTTCWGGSWASTIAADWKVYFCCHTRGLAEWCLGDLREQTLAEIWHSERRRQVMQNPLIRCPPLCRCDAMNRFLDQMRRPVNDMSFL